MRNRREFLKNLLKATVTLPIVPSFAGYLFSTLITTKKLEPFSYYYPLTNDEFIKVLSESYATFMVESFHSPSPLYTLIKRNEI